VVEGVEEVKVPWTSSTMTADAMLLPDAGRSGVLKYLKPEVMIIFSTYSLLYPLSRLNTDMLPVLPAGNEPARLSQLQPYCCFFKTLA
jgi:hypothetical protein